MSNNFTCPNPNGFMGCFEPLCGCEESHKNKLKMKELEGNYHVQSHNRDIRFKAFSKKDVKVYDVKQASLDESEIVLLQYTGFTDKHGKEIYDGDIISDEVMTDEGLVHSRQTVFWSQKEGAWALDHSSNQDATCHYPLAECLEDFEYEVVGNVFEVKD